jgi:hypothetical protein
MTNGRSVLAVQLALERLTARALDLLPYREDRQRTVITETSAASVAAALNDPKRSRIGDPDRNTWAISFTPRSDRELKEVSHDLDQLRVRHQINHIGGDGPAGSLIAYVAIYDLEEQRKLLSAVRDQLEPSRSDAFEKLVLARGPIPDDILAKMVSTIGYGKDYEYLADKMNELGIVAGRGKKWTPNKVRKAVANA